MQRQSVLARGPAEVGSETRLGTVCVSWLAPASSFCFFQIPPHSTCLPCDQQREEAVREGHWVRARDGLDRDVKVEGSLSPAFDVMYTYNPSGQLTGQQQMSINGKRDHFGYKDLMAFAETTSIKSAKAKSIIQQVAIAVRSWADYARKAEIDDATAEKLARAQRTEIFT